MTRDTTDDTDTRALLAIAKANSPAHLDPETHAIYPFEHFWEQFVTEFTTLE